MYAPPGGRAVYGGHGAAHLRAHRGPMVLTFGVVSSMCGVLAGSGCLCCLFWPVSLMTVLPAVGFGIPGIAIGVVDLRAMREGTMDISGRQMTMTGTVLAMVGVAAVLLGVLVWALSAFAGFVPRAVSGA
jgi:hypothetical protein